MAKEVIKKDGSKEPFDGEKIKRSIEGAAKAANLPPERITEIVERVSRAAIGFAETKEEISSSEIAEKILSELDVMEPSVAQAWRDFKSAGAEEAGAQEAGTQE